MRVHTPRPAPAGAGRRGSHARSPDRAGRGRRGSAPRLPGSCRADVRRAGHALPAKRPRSPAAAARRTIRAPADARRALPAPPGPLAKQPYRPQPRDGALPSRIIHRNEPVGQPGDHWFGAQSVKTIDDCRPVEQADQLHDRQQFGRSGQPFLFIRFEDAAGVVVARVVRVGKECMDLVARGAHRRCGSHRAGRQAVAMPRGGRRIRARLSAARGRCPRFDCREQGSAGRIGQMLDIDDRGGAVPPASEIGNLKPGGQHEEAMRRSRRRRREVSQQGAQSLVLQLAELRSRGRFATARPRRARAGPGGASALRRSFPPSASRWSSPALCRVWRQPNREILGRGRALLGTLAVKRPAEHHVGAAVIVGRSRFSHSLTSADLPAPPSATSEIMLMSGSAQAASSRASSVSRPTRFTYGVSGRPVMWT